MLGFALTSGLLLVLAVEPPGATPEAGPDVPSEALATPAGSVYRLQPWTDGLLLGATTLSWAFLELEGPSWVTPHCPCAASQVPRIDRGALHWHSQAADVASNVTEVIALLAPVAADFLDVGLGQAFLEDMVVYGEVLSISGTATAAAKFAVQRPRPYVYGTASTAVLRSPASYTSFFSGHTTVTFGALTTLAMTETLRHGPSPWPWLVVAVVGTSVAVERVLAGQHFPTDVLAGAAVGVGSGLLVPWLHRRSGPDAPSVALRFHPGGGELQLSGFW